eukprot:gnl/TRDRNA2_/TRDRNA2_177354_c10_seq6.p1 gnl/TRDRNA2_/TRDRNA2_177354_c10~~gnl/TRDRNA2_/TRDRNA2_177354_c10_seq6.p1  ORF type:complete len:128 (+),score=12.53 gnl/TRDRNA2_/TRDRNA2_177354_c10_seq6:2-385(+)
MVQTIKGFVHMSQHEDPTCDMWKAEGYQRVFTNQCQVSWSWSDVVGVYYVDGYEHLADSQRGIMIEAAETLLHVLKVRFPHRTFELVQLSRDQDETGGTCTRKRTIVGQKRPSVIASLTTRASEGDD